MAAANPYKQILSEIRAKRFAPVYILSGEEPYYIDLIADALQEYVVAEEERDFNLHLYYGQAADMETMINTAWQYPVMADRKLVMLREAQAMPSARTQLDKLEVYLKKPSPTTVLVVHFNGEALRDTSKLVKAAKAAKGVVYISPKTRDYELPRLLADYCKDHAVTLEPKASDMLCRNIGTNLKHLFGEVEKLRLSLPESDHISITADMVEANTGISKKYNSYELRSAILRRDYEGCMRIAAYYAANPNAPESRPETIAPVIFNTFADLLQAHYLKDKSSESLRVALNLKVRAAIDEMQNGLRNYNAWSCLRAIHAIRNYDCATKGIESAQPRPALLFELIYRLFTN